MRRLCLRRQPVAPPRRRIMSRRDLYAMTEGTELGLFAHYCRIAERKGHDWEIVFAAIPQVKPARVMSLVDLVYGPCPDCRANGGESCHPDCSSRWTDGEDTTE